MQETLDICNHRTRTDGHKDQKVKVIFSSAISLRLYRNYTGHYLRKEENKTNKTYKAIRGVCGVRASPRPAPTWYS